MKQDILPEASLARNHVDTLCVFAVVKKKTKNKTCVAKSRLGLNQHATERAKRVQLYTLLMAPMYFV